MTILYLSQIFFQQQISQIITNSVLWTLMMLFFRNLIAENANYTHFFKLICIIYSQKHKLVRIAVYHNSLSIQKNKEGNKYPLRLTKQN